MKILKLITFLFLVGGLTNCGPIHIYYVKDGYFLTEENKKVFIQEQEITDDERIINE